MLHLSIWSLCTIPMKYKKHYAIWRLLLIMQLLCKHKIGLHSATVSHSYPVIRLPREFVSLAGKMAHIYQTAYEGKLAFVMTVDKPVDKICANEERSQVEERLSSLESQINELKSLLFSNESEAFTKIKNRWARGDSNARPSPCKGDVITS